ncbi:Uma2 family endonuclease [Lamprocystis purpurea]|uniref:Uma2 family endonuclease n=1 Tax=Lamprocystis purpurea TaxID=61598 RepID=UPI00039C7976|nr:Uma2 family endonuclease [Lamprocystis purpurea]
MAGTIEHNAIVVNIVSELSIRMKGRPCQVYANDLKVRIRSADTGKSPDLIALCGEHQFHDGRRDVLLNPRLIVEVLSDSTEACDRGKKIAIYRQIPSFREYLLVSQHQVQVDLFSRANDGRWTLSDYSALTDCVPLCPASAAPCRWRRSTLRWILSLPEAAPRAARLPPED